ncbi:hypothetical protein H4R34_004779, partial [Dimargaris verticillata]
SNDGGSACYSLKASKYCGAGFGDFHVSRALPVGDGVPVNAEELDKLMDRFLGTASDEGQINQQYGCHGWKGSDSPQYRISYMCRSLLDNTASQQCNVGRTIPPLCQSSCDTYTQGWKDFLLNADNCPNQGLTQALYQQLRNSCQSSAYGGSSNDQCIRAEDNEPDTCGFLPNQMDAACSFCDQDANRDSACCRTLVKGSKCPNLTNSPNNGTFYPSDHTSTTKLLAIILPCVFGGLFLLGLLLFFLYRRRQRKRDRIQGLLPTTTLRGQKMFNGKVGSTFPTVVPKEASSGDAVKCRVTHVFTPRMEDEILLTPGDKVLIYKTFDDGWAVGYNLSTGQQGTVPMVCVTALTAESLAAESKRSTDHPSARGDGGAADDTLSAADIEKSLMSLNASAAAIAATVSAANSSGRPSIGGRSARTIRPDTSSVLPRRSSSRGNPNSGSRPSLVSTRTSLASNHHPADVRN